VKLFVGAGVGVVLLQLVEIAFLNRQADILNKETSKIFGVARQV
jgi:hypothetical protein